MTCRVRKPAKATELQLLPASVQRNRVPGLLVWHGGSSVAAVLDGRTGIDVLHRRVAVLDRGSVDQGFRTLVSVRWPEAVHVQEGGHRRRWRGSGRLPHWHFCQRRARHVYSFWGRYTGLGSGNGRTRHTREASLGGGHGGAMTVLCRGGTDDGAAKHSAVSQVGTQHGRRLGDPSSRVVRDRHTRVPEHADRAVGCLDGCVTRPHADDPVGRVNGKPLQNRQSHTQ